MLIHGIWDKDVVDSPSFNDLAKEIHTLIKDSDLGGFNSNRFDIPLLAEEMLRADIDFDMKNRCSVDVQTIFHKMEQRTLSAAYKFYCYKNLDDAHSAEADTRATYEVLKAQLDRYDNLENDVKLSLNLALIKSLLILRALSFLIKKVKSVFFWETQRKNSDRSS